ncbi:MAG: BLUF domain-containing protein, partial [Jatrophihabitantaceae bacterium]
MNNEASGHPYFRLTYRSRDLIPAPDRKEVLGELFSEARSRNKQQQISGALLISDDCFVQTIEGEQAAVQALYERIRNDLRHDSVVLLAAGPVDELVFSRWSMARVADDLDEPDTFLLAGKDGISPAASLRPNT